MREIQFRAKRCDNGEWAYSKTIAANTPLDGGDDRWFIGAGQPADQYINKNGNMVAVETTGECLFYAIDPETLGQYTGLTDKNGTKIFEGDCLGSLHNVIEFIDGEWIVAGDRRLVNLHKRYEIVGNTHDNPELLVED